MGKLNTEKLTQIQDTLAVGVTVQARRFREIKEAKEVRGEYRWLDGDVIAVVMTPCDGVDWVAMVQWRDGNDVIAWEAIPSHTWHASTMFRRKPTNQT